MYVWMWVRLLGLLVLLVLVPQMLPVLLVLVPQMLPEQMLLGLSVPKSVKFPVPAPAEPRFHEPVL